MYTRMTSRRRSRRASTRRIHAKTANSSNETAKMGMGIELPTEAERMGEEMGEVEAAEAVAEGVVVVEGVAELGPRNAKLRYC